MGEAQARCQVRSLSSSAIGRPPNDELTNQRGGAEEEAEGRGGAQAQDGAQAEEQGRGGRQTEGGTWILSLSLINDSMFLLSRLRSAGGGRGRTWPG